MANPTTDKPESPDAECSAAIQLGLRALIKEGLDGGPYKLVEARNLLKGEPKSDPAVWRLTFKARRLIPSAADGVIGAGGEVAIEVNLASGRAQLTSRGD